MCFVMCNRRVTKSGAVTEFGNAGKKESYESIWIPNILENVSR